MSKIKIDFENLVIKKNIEERSKRREEINKRLGNITDELRDFQTRGFIEEIVEKLDEHIDNVDRVQINNISYLGDFLENIINEFTEVDENIIKK